VTDTNKLPLYNTWYLNRMVEKVKPMPRFFLSRYFPDQVNHDTEEIYFDVVEHSHGLTPFVHPLHQGKVLKHRGYQTKSYKPAYLKEKVVHDAERPLTREAGEQFGGSMSAEQRARTHILKDIQELKERFMNRLEIMALEICKYGQVTIKGEGFDHVVNFQRNPALTVIAGDDESKWSNHDFDMRKFFEERARDIRKYSNRTARAVDIIMGSEAWDHFVENKQFEKLMDIRRGVDSTIPLTPMEQSEDIQYKGHFGDFNIFVHYGIYNDTDVKEEKKFLGANEVLMAAKSIEGVRHFGMIKDRKAKWKAIPYFLKSWEDEDPSHLYIMIQSAPLLVTYDPNAMCLMEVL
jgi:hypothetical protein